jgi:large subunit ribosomal protein L6
MSRIGNAPIKIPEGVTVDLEKNSRFGGQTVIVNGPLGNLKQDLRREITVKIEKGMLVLERKNEEKYVKSLHGLYRTLIANMVSGVTKAFEKKLEIVGIGYRAELKGEDLELTLGATHPYIIKAPEGITFEVQDRVNITIKGIDKQLVGQIAAKIRELSKPEPYKGKGVRYEGEYIRRKVGKAAKASEEGGE